MSLVQRFASNLKGLKLKEPAWLHVKVCEGEPAARADQVWCWIWWSGQAILSWRHSACSGEDGRTGLSLHTVQ